MGNWSTGLKIALSVLGVVLFATAIQTFVNWQPSSKFGAGVFTIGAALVAGVIGSKFLPAGATAGLLTAGLALGGYQMVGDKVAEFGQNIGNSIRGNGGAPVSATSPVVPNPGSTTPGGAATPLAGAVPTTFNPAGAVPTQPASQTAQPVTIIQQAAKGPSDFAFITGKVLDSVGTFLGGQDLFGSKGVDQFEGSLGANDIDELAELVS